MKNQSWLTKAIVVSLLTVLLSTLCSAAGIYAVADHGLALDLHAGVGVLMIGLGICAWIGPPIFWLYTLRGSEWDEAETQRFPSRRLR